MLLTEQFRNISKETSLVNDSATYQSPSGVVHDWTTRVTKTITLPEALLVYIGWSSHADNGQGATRVLVDGVPFLSSGHQASYSTLWREGFIMLAAGTHTLDFQTAMWSGGTGFWESVSGIIVGAFSFTDLDTHSYDSGGVNAPANATTTVLNQTFTTPPARKLAVGTVRKYTVLVFFHFTNEDVNIGRCDSVKSPGESDDSLKLNWKLFWAATQTAWTDKNPDWDPDSSSNITYGVGAFARVTTTADPNSQLNLVVKVANTQSVNKTVHCRVQVTVCPWIIPNATVVPVNLDFPQGSTLYAVLEPLTADPTKTIKLGKVRGRSFGDADDFYSTATGTGILSWSYTFDTVYVANCQLNIAGDGACISILAVDVR